MAESPYIVDVTRENFAQVIEASSKVPVLIDFWAGWCQPCKVLMPVLAKLAEEYEGRFLLAKLDTEANQELAARFGIRSIPTVKLVRDGRLVDEFMGALPEKEVRAFLDRHIGRESDGDVAEAEQRLKAGDTEGAIVLLKKARADDPDNSRITLALAQAQAVAGDVAAAEATLDSLPDGEKNKPEALALRGRFYFAEQVAGVPPMPDLEAALASKPDDPETRLQLALRKVVDEDYDAALELLLDLMRRNRAFGEDAARRTLLKVFELLGSDPRVGVYRRRMTSLLY